MTKIIYFSAPWCSPCKVMYPMLQDSCANNSAFIEKVDIDENPDLASYYGILQVPTIIKFVDNEEVSRMSGLQNKWTLDKFVSEA